MKKCTGCLTEKDLNCFSPRKDGVLGKASRCIECRRNDRQLRRDEENHKRREKRKTDPEYKARNAMAVKKYKEANRIKIKMANQSRRIAKRVTVLERYGGKCECCGEENYCFLSIDHINGGGNEERRLIGGSNGVLKKLLQSQEKLDGYRILCHNCNMASAMFGRCPHKMYDGLTVTDEQAV